MGLAAWGYSQRPDYILHAHVVPLIMPYSPLLPRPRDWPSHFHYARFDMLSTSQHAASGELHSLLEAHDKGEIALVLLDQEHPARACLLACLMKAQMRCILLGTDGNGQHKPAECAVSAENDADDDGGGGGSIWGGLIVDLSAAADAPPLEWLLGFCAVVVHQGRLDVTEAAAQAKVGSVVLPCSPVEWFWSAQYTTSKSLQIIRVSDVAPLEVELTDALIAAVAAHGNIPERTPSERQVVEVKTLVERLFARCCESLLVRCMRCMHCMHCMHWYGRLQVRNQTFASLWSKPVVAAPANRPLDTIGSLQIRVGDGSHGVAWLLLDD